MNDGPDSSLIDMDDLKRQIADAVRAVLQEEADKRGMSIDEFLDHHFGADRAEASASEL